MNNSYDRWLTTPPDEVEQEYCEYCNQEMEYHCDRLDKRTKDEYWKCLNPFCPQKFEGNPNQLVRDMAQELVETKDSLKSAQNSLKYVRNILVHLEDIRQQRELTIETFEAEIENLTQSQSNVVLRDTDYAIRLMEDAIEYVYLDCCMTSHSRSVIWKNWVEVKKILTQL